MSVDQAREYDLVVFGATGYTGVLIAQYITRQFPTNFNWAIAGRSHQKLSNLLQDLKKNNLDRREPAIEVAQLDLEDLNELARKTKVILTTVGPYHIYGENAIRACATHGTHYLDVTGESPWTIEMIAKYQDQARSTGAVILPHCGLMSAPADTLTVALVRLVRQKLDAPTRQVNHAVTELKGGPSGGTLATVFGVYEQYGLKTIVRSSRPGAMCPIAPPKIAKTDSLLSRLLGVRSVPDLGLVKPNPVSGVDTAIVYRSWGLYNNGELYGKNFDFRTLTTVQSRILAAVSRVIYGLMPLFLILSPVRWLLKKLVHQPGSGPDIEKESKSGRIEERSVAIPDSDDKRKAFGRLRWQGGLYMFTAVLVSEAAATLLNDRQAPAHKLGGGFVTPATLGEGYIDRLREGGILLETEILDE